MTKKPLWNLRFGNKGIIFTLDAMIALVIVLTSLIASNIYILKSVNQLPNLEILREGYDIVTLMDHNNILQSLNPDYIKNQMDIIVPSKYNIIIRISSDGGQEISIGGTEIPNDRFIGSGKRFSVITNSNNSTFITTRFWIWLK